MTRIATVGYVLAITALFAHTAPAQAKQKEGAAQAKKEAGFTLETIFPDKKKPLFGPRASRPAFSHDGKHAAWLHKTYEERRHGNDLWILDTASRKARRLTTTTLMAQFQADSRKVVDDRVKKGEKTSSKKGKKKKAEKSGKGKHDELGNRVGEKDYDDEKAPRYSGISTFTWSPTADELLFTSLGDIYRYKVGDAEPTRLTCTERSERDVQYLPDGKGYSYLLDGALMKVKFGSHLLMQVNPKLPSGESMTGYELSPNGKHLVFLTRKGQGRSGGERKVNIARYRDRFMQVREVSRHVSDDPMPPAETMVYLYDLAGAMLEKGRPARVYTHKISGPRDILRVPEWSPDSSRVTFAVFEQTSAQVLILEATMTEDAKKEKKKKVTAKAEEKKDSESKDKAEAKSAKSGADDKRYVERPARVVYRFLHHGGPTTPRMMQPMYLADSRRIAFLSEQTGFRHIHVLDPLYESQRPLTVGRFEVYPVDMSKDHKTLFVTATKEHPARLGIYGVDLESGKMKPLSTRPGSYSSVAVSGNGKAALANFVSFRSLRELVLIARGTQVALTDSHPAVARRVTTVAPQFFNYNNRHGHQIWGTVFKPTGWSTKDKRPLLLYVYGGPLGTRKQVTDGNFHSASYFFAQYMAREHGYVTCTIDPRGMSGYGGVFEKANFEQVGKPQIEDLVDGVEHMIEHYGVDPDRVGMHGWSFGGFQTQMCMYEAPDTFQVGIAGAGPTEWENYNSWYSTGTIGNSRTGQTDLKKYSLLPLAKKLRGKLLLVHGMEDSNVLYQDTVRIYRELLKADKETLVELFLDPTGGHGLGGDISTLRRYRKYEEFLVRNLGSGKPAERPSISTGPAAKIAPAAESAKTKRD